VKSPEPEPQIDSSKSSIDCDGILGFSFNSIRNNKSREDSQKLKIFKKSIDHITSPIRHPDGSRKSGFVPKMKTNYSARPETYAQPE